MILFYVNSNQKNHARILLHLYNSYPGEKQIEPTNRFMRNSRLNLNASLIVFAGMIRGEGMIYHWCVAHNKRFFYVDHAYLDRGYNQGNPDNEWMRITDSAFTWTGMDDCTSDRWDTLFGNRYPIKPWMTNASGNILVLPPSNASLYLFPYASKWINGVVEEASKISRLPVVVREKPNQVVIDDMNNVVDRIEHTHTKTIDEELATASLVISFNSAVTVMATILGIPSIVSNNAASFPVSQSINTIINSPEPPREKWLHQLVHHQYTTTEMKDGTVWNQMLK